MKRLLPLILALASYMACAAGHVIIQRPGAHLPDTRIIIQKPPQVHGGPITLIAPDGRPFVVRPGRHQSIATPAPPAKESK